MPWLCKFRGLALFLDADMVVAGDIAELFDTYDMVNSVQVNKQQAVFEWPSAMLFDCSRCSALTPQYVDDPSNKLFDFAWARQGEYRGVGEFPPEWNHAVGYAPARTDAKLYHFTKGVPVWRETRGNVEDNIFYDAMKHMLHTVSHAELMGNSVHVRKAG